MNRFDKAERRQAKRDAARRRVIRQSTGPKPRLHIYLKARAGVTV